MGQSVRDSKTSSRVSNVHDLPEDGQVLAREDPPWKACLDLFSSSKEEFNDYSR